MLRLIFIPAAAVSYFGTMVGWELVDQFALDNGQAPGWAHLLHLTTSLGSPVLGSVLGWKLGEWLEKDPQPPAGPA